MKHTRVFRDSNHLTIMHDLQKMGMSVCDLAAVGSGVPDLIVANGRVTVLIEIKMPKSQIYLSQLEFLARWQGYSGFAETTDQALALLTQPETSCLSATEKQIVLEIIGEWRTKTKTADLRPKIRIMEFEKQLAERLVFLA